MKRFALSLLVATLQLALAVQLFAATGEKRVALVIGNGRYTSAPLSNPANDAEDMAALLKKLGFEVILRRDAGKQAMEQAVQEFYRRLQGSQGVGLFYYAGHGLQVQGQNYLVPVDAAIESEGDVGYRAIDAGWVLRKMEDAQNPVNIVVLDACRNNPFTRRFRSAEKGLAQMPSPTGSIISYATAPGSVAADGEGRNGLYTRHLLRRLASRSLSIEEVFAQVRQDVWTESGKKQTPWTSTSLMGRVSLATGTATIETEPASPPVEEPGQNVPQTVAGSASGGRLSNSLGMAFVRIAPGSFGMGSPPSESGGDSDETRLRVTLTRGYDLQTTEVTQGQWIAVMGSNPSFFSSCGDDCPVEQVSWIDVLSFIAKLNARGEGSYRLPTEAEWEYACRAESAGRFGFGDDENRLAEYAWYDGNSDGKTHPVATRKVNDWGLFDMHGNVREWCSDWYGGYPTGAAIDPTGPMGGSYRVIRGGSWFSRPADVRSAYRFRLTPGDRGDYLGFRLVRTD